MCDRVKYGKQKAALERLREVIPQVIVASGKYKRTRAMVVSEAVDEIKALEPVYYGRIDEREKLIERNEQLRERVKELKKELGLTHDDVHG